MFPCMKLKHLQSNLQEVKLFQNPKVELEQYSTPVHLASEMLYAIQTEYDDIDGHIVADLGCGSGVLSIGSVILDASFVVGFDIDTEALDTFKDNLEEYEISNIDLVQADVSNSCSFNKFYGVFDTVIMNPPFGTKHNEGIDIMFLNAALKISNGAVYSLHKTSTRNYIQKYCKENNINANVIAEMRYDIPKTFKFHKKKSSDIFVDFYRFEKQEIVEEDGNR